MNRKRAPSLTDSLAEMPPESPTDAAVRKAFSEPEAPKLIHWAVRTVLGTEDIQAHRMIVSPCGSLSFMTDNQIWLVIAAGHWMRATRSGET